MGTRNLTLVKSKNEYKIAQFGRFDGYPSGQGSKILKTITGDFNFDEFRNKVDNLKQYTDLDINKKMMRFTGPDADKKFVKKYPELSQVFAGEIIQAVYTGKVKTVFREVRFAANSVFCEWAYVIDLDTNTFEVYHGVNYTPLNKDDRFYYLQSIKSKYYPLRKQLSWSLYALPSVDEFMTQCETMSKKINEEFEETLTRI